MRVGFLVEAHSDPTQLARLCGRLSGHGIFIHVDAKAGPFPLIEGATHIEPRRRVHWAGFSQVEATLDLLRAAFDSPAQHDMFVLLSGSCYPIGSVRRLTDAFAAQPGRSWIKYVQVDESAHLQSLSDRYFYRDEVLPAAVRRITRNSRLVERTVRKAREVLDVRVRERPAWVRAHGSNWWALTREHADYVLAFVDDPKNAGFIRYYKHAFASDEQFFHTILANSPFAEIRAERVPFEGRGTYRCANLHLIDPSLTRWWVESDYEEINASGRYFVRKVRSDVSAGLLTRLDAAAELGERV